MKQVSTTKSLGIPIHDNLMWHSQIEKITQKIASGIGAIERIRPFVFSTSYFTLHLQCLAGTTPSDKLQKRLKCASALLLPPIMMLMLGAYYSGQV